MFTVFTKVVVVFAIIGVGFYCNKKNILPDSVEQPLVDLLLTITTPCMVLSSLASKTLEAGTMSKTFLVIGLSLGYFIIAPILSLFFKRFLKNTSPKDVGVMMAVMTSINTGFMGFPITKAIFGEDIFFLIVLQNIALNIYFFSIAILQINYGHDEAKDIRSALKAVINPCIIAAVLGLLILFTQIKLPAPLLEFITMLGDVTTPISMLVVGMRLARSNLMNLLKNRDLIFASIVNMLIMPVVFFLLCNWLPITSDVKLLMVWAASFPSAVIIIPLSVKYNRNATLAAEGMALTTIISLIVLPLSATILTAIYL